MSAAEGGHQASIFEVAHCVSERWLTPSTVMIWTQRLPREFRIRRMEQAINLHTEPNPLICRGIRSLVRGATSSQSGPHSRSRRRDVHPGIVGHVDALDIEASSKTPPCRERPNGSETGSTEAKVTCKSRIHDGFQNCYQKVVALRDSSRLVAACGMRGRLVAWAVLKCMSLGQSTRGSTLTPQYNLSTSIGQIWAEQKDPKALDSLTQVWGMDKADSKKLLGIRAFLQNTH